MRKQIKRSKLFSWNFIFDFQGGFIVYYTPDGKNRYRIKVDSVTKQLAENLMNQIQTWLSQKDFWEGTVVSHWKLVEKAVPETTVEIWEEQ